MAILRALINIPKEQLKGDGQDKGKWVNVPSKPITMAEPTYTTESAVTLAIASGTFKGSAVEAYRLAAEWQKQVKASESRRFYKPPAKPRESKAYMHTYGFSR